MPKVSEHESVVDKCFTAGQCYQDSEQEKEETNAWQHMQAAWMASCIPDGTKPGDISVHTLHVLAVHLPFNGYAGFGRRPCFRGRHAVSTLSCAL